MLGVALASLFAVLFAMTASTAPEAQSATAAIDFTSALVRTVDLAAISPPSPDPSGIGFVSSTDRLIVVDGDVEEDFEGVTHFQGANLWELNLDGSVVRSANVSKVDFPAGVPSPTPMTDEPTGVASKPSNGHYFFSDDTGMRVFELSLGGDGSWEPRTTPGRAS